MKKVPRGGFTTPPGFSQAAKNALRAAAAQARAPRNHGDAAEIAKNLLVDTAVKVGDKIIDNISRPSGVGGTGGGSGAHRRPIPMSHEKGLKMEQTTVNSAVNRMTHHHKIETGYPSTRGIKRLESNNGRRKEVLYDTKGSINGRTDIGSDRTHQSHSAGFNSRNFLFLPATAFCTTDDVISVSGINTVAQPVPSATSEKVYAAIKRCISEVTIYNQSAYFPMKCKVHLISFTDPNQDAGFTIADLQTRVFNGSLTTQTEGRVPIRYQHRDPLAEGNTADGSRSFNVDMSLKGKGLMDSPWFRDNCVIAKTITQRIEPNCQMQFKHVHHCGPGIDIIQTLSQWGLITADGSSMNKNPVSYWICIESCGYPCEAIIGTGVQGGDPVPTPYLGTSPVNFFLEWRKTMEYVTEEIKGQDIVNGAPTTYNAAMRVFTNDDYSSTEREIFVLPEFIVDDPASLGIGLAYVPVLTDKLVRYEQTTSGAGDNQ